MTNSDSLSKMLKSSVLVFDGAMGTELYKRNFFVNTCFDELCLSAPSVITGIHGLYVEAGADVITTNSFGANANKLSRFGLADKAALINKAAVDLAKKSCVENTMVAASVGPIGKITFNSGLDDEKIVKILAEQIRYLEDAGADFILFETLPCMKDVEYACRAAAAGSTLPYILSISVDRNGESSKGEPLNKILSPLDNISRKPSALGLNCGTGPEGTLGPFEKLLEISPYPIIVQPNAGLPKDVEGRMIYMASPEYFTTYALRFVNLGARGIGGCCGTTPEHIRDIARSIKPLAGKMFKTGTITIEEKVKLKDPVPTAEKSDLSAKLCRKEWIKTVEIVPPRGFMLEKTIEKAILCREAGVDAINIPDGPRASSRMSPLISACRIQNEAKIEVILHFCCRDRNLIGMQSDLLGCASAGIVNLLFITGDPPKLGDYPFASAVFDADSIGMVAIQSKLNMGVDIGGHPIDSPTKALIGVGADPNSIDMERELRRTREKIEAGAEFIITQPVFAVEPLLEFIRKIENLKIPVIAGIWPLASFRNAEFMKNEVPGVIVPDQIMKRMADAKTKEEQRDEGIMIAREIVDNIRGSVAGIQVSAPFGNVATAISVLESSP